jgi:hypothetical protein
VRRQRSGRKEPVFVFSRKNKWKCWKRVNGSRRILTQMIKSINGCILY